MRSPVDPRAEVQSVLGPMDLGPSYAVRPMSCRQTTPETGCNVAMMADSASTQPAAIRSDAPHPSVRRRRCYECGAFLSKYNRSERYCFIHELPHAKRFTW
jgi:hypothetical protein